MKKKATGVTIIYFTLLLLFNIQGSFGPIGALIATILYTAGIMFLKKTSNSGEWLKNMGTGFWTVNIAAFFGSILVALLDYSDVFAFSDTFIAYATKIVAAINGFILTMGTTTPMLQGDRTALSVKK